MCPAGCNSRMLKADGEFKAHLSNQGTEGCCNHLWAGRDPQTPGNECLYSVYLELFVPAVFWV